MIVNLKRGEDDDEADKTTSHGESHDADSAEQDVAVADENEDVDDGFAEDMAESQRASRHPVSTSNAHQ